MGGIDSFLRKEHKANTMDDLSDSLGLDYEDEDNLDITYLVFEVAGEQYAVHASQVTEIVRLQTVVALPDVPLYIKGVMSLRGRVIPIMDMRLRCGLGAEDYNDRTVVIVLEVQGRVTGLVVDTVVEVIEIPDDTVDASTVTDSTNSVIRGLGRRETGVVILVDAVKLLFDMSGDVTLGIT